MIGPTIPPFVDGSPDDRLLATMQYVAGDAQTQLMETGQLPADLKGLIDAANAREDGELRSFVGRYAERSVPQNITYLRLSSSSIRLCGAFQQASSGQEFAWPYYDFAIELESALAFPHPAGRHCYDIPLQTIDAATRNDALLFRKLDTIATAAECYYADKSVLPQTIDDARLFIGRDVTVGRLPECNSINTGLLNAVDVEYSDQGGAVVRMCASFQRAYDSAQKFALIFDPRRNARFVELGTSQSQAGRRCYDIGMLVPDPVPPTTVERWEDPLKVENAAPSDKESLSQDKRAIGDVSNVLRLARCGYTFAGAAADTLEQAVQTVSQVGEAADRYNCDWVPRYFSSSGNAPVASYEKIDDDDVRVCVNYARARPIPLALEYYYDGLSSWPVSLPELQRAIPQPGRHCYAVRLTRIGSGVI